MREGETRDPGVHRTGMRAQVTVPAQGLLLGDSPDERRRHACSMLLRRSERLKMKRNFLLSSGFYLFTSMVALGQSGPAPVAASANGNGQIVSYASVTQLNGMLEQL